MIEHVSLRDRLRRLVCRIRGHRIGSYPSGARLAICDRCGRGVEVDQ